MGHRRENPTGCAAVVAALVVVAACVFGGCESAAAAGAVRLATGAISAKAIGNGALGAAIGRADSLARGNDDAAVLEDTVNGFVSSAATSIAGDLAGPARLPKVAGEAMAAYGVSKATGSSDTEAAISAAVTGVVSYATNNSTLSSNAAGATNLLKPVVVAVVKKLTSEEAKETSKGACRTANREGC